MLEAKQRVLIAAVCRLGFCGSLDMKILSSVPLNKDQVDRGCSSVPGRKLAWPGGLWAWAWAWACEWWGGGIEAGFY